ncbi:uncharacterized protein LOC144537352 [Sander vitreus]
MAQATSKTCSVPGCCCYSQKQPYLSFHSFPVDGEVRRRWFQAIRREEGPDFTIITGSTYVCSRHFTLDDYVLGMNSPFSITIRRLRPDAVPSLFPWNDFTPEGKKDRVYERSQKRPPVPSVGVEIKDITRPPVPSVGVEIKDITRPPVPSVGVEIKDITRPPVPSVGVEIKDITRQSVTSVGAEIKKALYDALKQDHDYATPPPAGMLDGTVDYIQYLEAELKKALPSSDLFSRYCASDDQMRFYTRFPSERVFRIFWESIAPSASQLVYWNKAQMISEGTSDISPSPPRTLPLIDEFLIYCMQVAVGMKEEVLADMFQVRLTTVTRVTITWANYLYFILGTLPLWASREKVKSVMPGKFKKCCPNVRVILDCTEIPVAAASSRSLQSETSSHSKNRTTLKGLIGVAPHGLVTFFSPLYAGSISGKDITQISGILPLLESGDEVMADEGFIIEELLSGVGAKLVTPQFERSGQFTREDTEKTQAIARLRTVVERVIGRIKSNHIWDSPVPLTLMCTVSQIWHNCCVMVNFQGPLSFEED